MGNKLNISISADEAKYIEWYCPGCGATHTVKVPGWTWDGNEESPTFSPSVLVNAGRANPEAEVCHTFIRAGRIEYLPDCSHALAGQTVDLPDIPEDWQ